MSGVELSNKNIIAVAKDITVLKDVNVPTETDALKGEEFQGEVQSDRGSEEINIEIETEIAMDTCCFGVGKKKRPTNGCCGFELEKRPDFSVWEKEDKQVLFIPLFFLVIGLIGAIMNLIDPVLFEALAIPADPLGYALVQLVVGFSITVFWFPLGCLVWYFGVNVAVTRKVTHVIFMMLIPFAAISGALGGIQEGDTLYSQMWRESVWGSFMQTAIMIAFYIKPVRKAIPYFRISFASVERTEDMPFALNWTMMQATATTVVQTPMFQWMVSQNKGLLVFIPSMAVALGDGLAEPVGKLYGKHKYETIALFTKQKFTRSYEGSACVFFFTALSVICAMPEMTWPEFAMCMLTIPLASTLLEAKSPHTWDNHMIWLGIWLLLWLIFDMISPAFFA